MTHCIDAVNGCENHENYVGNLWLMMMMVMVAVMTLMIVIMMMIEIVIMRMMVIQGVLFYWSLPKSSKCQSVSKF